MQVHVFLSLYLASPFPAPAPAPAPYYFALTCLAFLSSASLANNNQSPCYAASGGHIEGDIRMNGHPKEQTSFARVSGYVEQNDVHSPQTTVREALNFSAQLRFAQGVPGDTIQAFVDEVMGLVELTVLQSVLVSLQHLLLRLLLLVCYICCCGCGCCCCCCFCRLCWVIMQAVQMLVTCLDQMAIELSVTSRLH